MDTLFDYSRVRYINPLTDFGFKKIFGDKEVMTAFLTDLLQPSSPIKDLIFLDKELVPDNDSYRGVIYDLRCMTEDGGEFIVEMQLLYLRTIQMTVNETGEVFSDKLKAFTLEIPDFRNKSEDYPKTKIEYWLYNLANMQKFTGSLPFTKEQPAFKKVGKISEIAKLSPEDMLRYEKNVDDIRTNRNAISYARNEGMEKGIEIGREEGREEGIEIGREEGREEGIEIGMEKGKKEGILKVAQTMKEMGLPIGQIAQATRLTEEEIAEL